MIQTFCSIIIYVSFMREVSGSWHAYDPNRVACANTSNFDKSSNNVSIIDPGNVYKLWPGIFPSQNASQPDFIYGFETAIDVVWNHQHPKNCSNSKFLIATQHRQGFASEIHVYGSILALAMNLGRVLLQFPFNHHDMLWQNSNDYCTNQTTENPHSKHNSECYYEPWSSCTIADALGPDWNRSSFESFEQQENMFEIFYVNNKEILKQINRNHFENLTGKYNLASKTMTFSDYYDQEQFSRIIPYHFESLLYCSPVNDDFYYYWWRAIASSYLFRPNDATLKWLDDYKDIQISNQTKSIAVYMRRGDKAREMKLVPNEK